MKGAKGPCLLGTTAAFAGATMGPQVLIRTLALMDSEMHAAVPTCNTSMSRHITGDLAGRFKSNFSSVLHVGG